MENCGADDPGTGGGTGGDNCYGQNITFGQIQDDKIRVNGKKIDDLQAAIAHLKSKDMGVPLQFVNFK